MKKLLLYLIYFPGFLFPGISLCQEVKQYEIAAISVAGAGQIEQEAVLMNTGLNSGDIISIPGEEIAGAIKALWSQNIYADISVAIERIVDDKVFLLVNVKERSRIAKYSFRGAPKGHQDDLRDKISFIKGTIWSPEKERRAKRIIRNFYIEKGFLNTEVQIKDEPDPVLANGVDITIDVRKGSRVKINRIRFEGNQVMSDAKLKAAGKVLKERKMWRLWARSKYLPKDMPTEKENMVAFYNKNGYRDAQVIHDTVTVHDEKSVDVELKIVEGNQYYFRDISWSGNYKYNADTLGRMLGLETGDIYNAEQLNTRLNGDPAGRDIASLYLDDGYLFFNLEPVEVMVEGDSIDIEIRVFEGPQATIRKVIVEGNTKTSDYVILRELRTLPGQKFSRTDLIRSQREILNLGFFNQENLQVVPLPDSKSGTVDIKYVVEEKPSDQLQVQGGWGGRIRNPQTGEIIGGGFVGTVSLAFNNFSTRRFFKPGGWRPIPSGDGQKLSIAAQLNGVGWQNYSLSFLEPWIGGKKPNSLGASVSYSINRNPNTDFSMKTIATSLDYGRRLKIPDDFFRSYTSAGYKYYDLNNANSFFGGTSLDQGFINIFTLRETFDRTSIDAPLFPRTGSTLTLSMESTPPYSLFRHGTDYAELTDTEKYKWLEYHKITFNGLWYFPIDSKQKLILRPRIQAGFLGTYNPDYGISPFERFNLGGSGFGAFNFFGQEFVSLRGYQQSSIGPREDDSNVLSPTVGGNIYNKFSFELRYPLTLNQAAPIWAVAFAEAGNSWLGFENYDPFDLKRSAGLGIRVVVPMIGLLGVDWGYGFDPLVRGGQPAGSNFSFILGQEF